MKKLLLTLLVTLQAFSFTVFFDAGGAPGDSYATVVSNGAKLAAKDLGIELKIYHSDWDPNKMVVNFQSALAQNPDGIVIMGHPGDKLYAPLVKKAIEQGVAISSLDTKLPEIYKENYSKGFGYVGTDNYLAGVAMANEILRVYKLKENDEVFLWGLKSQPIRGLRAKAITEILEKAKVKITYVEISPEVNKDPSLGQNIFQSVLLKNPNIKLAIIDHGALTAATPKFMKNLKIDPKDLTVVGFSLSPATMQGIEDGYLALIADGQPFVQGYLSVWQVYFAKKFGFSGFNIDTSGGFITKDNIDFIKPLVKDGIR